MPRSVRTSILLVLSALALVGWAAGCGGSGDAAPVRRQIPPTVSAPIPESPVAARGAVTHLPQCLGELTTRPKAIVLACADANASITELRWTNWGADVATGTGVAVLNSCDPTCVDGRFVQVDSTVTLDRIEELEASARYRRMRVFFAPTRPSWVPAQETYELTDRGPLLVS